MEKSLRTSVGIMAHNEEKNIKRLLDFLIKEKERLKKEVTLSEIFVVASGCTDKTVSIVKKLTRKYPFVKLIVEKKRTGKASAINLFLKNANEEIITLVNADNLPEKNCLKELLLPFWNSKVGMVGGRPLPLNPENKFIGYLVHLLWRLHHRIALLSPKCGEIVAFRKVIKNIPADTPVDEAVLEHLIKEKGLELKYAKKATSKIQGPKTVTDYISQRRRINFGHLWLAKNYHYRVSTLNLWLILKSILKEISLSPLKNIWLIFAIIIEAYSWILAFFDFYFRKKNPYIWEIIKSTKQLEFQK